MKVSELISFLEKQPADLTVVYTLYSEQCVLEADDIVIETMCAPRADGWVQDLRPDMPSQTYLVFPGN